MANTNQSFNAKYVISATTWNELWLILCCVSNIFHGKLIVFVLKETHTSIYILFPSRSEGFICTGLCIHLTFVLYISLSLEIID